MNKISKSLTLFLSIALIVTGTAIFPKTHAQESAIEGVPVIELDPAFAVDWIQLIYDRIYAEGHNPPLAARVYGYAGITLYESLLNGIPGNYSLAGQIVHMPDMPLPPDGTYDWLAVANHSLYRMMSELLPIKPETEAETREILTAHYEAIKAEREAESGADVVAFSIDYADMLTDSLMAWMREDGIETIRALPPYEIPDYFGEAGWVVTTEGQVPVEPYWGQMRPFRMEFSSDCRVPLNIEFSTEPDSTFYKQAQETEQIGVNLTQEQIDTAYFWVDTPRISGTPAGHWMLIAGLMVEQLDMPLDYTAEMYAIVGMAVSDAFISTWESKYSYMLLRPVTYIQRYIRRSWGPLIETPGFPEYPSGHSVVSGAAATVLTDLFGQVAFTDTTGLSRDLQPRSFTSFEAAASEAGISRIYGGIHYRVAIENGLAQGRCVGGKVYDTIRLHPFRQGE